MQCSFVYSVFHLFVPLFVLSFIHPFVHWFIQVTRAARLPEYSSASLAVDATQQTPRSNSALAKLNEEDDSVEDDRDSCHSDSGSDFLGRRKSMPMIHRTKNYPTGMCLNRKIVLLQNLKDTFFQKKIVICLCGGGGGIFLQLYAN